MEGRTPPPLPSLSFPFPWHPSPRVEAGGPAGVLPWKILKFTIAVGDRVLAHFRSKKYGFWLKVLARENIEYSCD